MDILISSNLERLIYHSCGNDAVKTASLMDELKKTGSYTVTDDMRERISDFVGGFATEEDNLKTIGRVFNNEHYLMDTHTGVAATVYDNYRKETGDNTVTVIASTASPYKFGRAVLKAVTGNDSDADDFKLADELNEISGVKIPEAVNEIRTAPVRHKRECDKAAMQGEVEDILGL